MRIALSTVALSIAVLSLSSGAHAHDAARAPEKTPLIAPNPIPPSQQPKPETLPAITKSRVELVFVIDTTGSMGGLIEGAKRKIWSIANEVMKAKQKPEVRIGLVAYRDKGDAYVTQTVPLTSDLDKIFAQLMALHADGGGDGPEHVNAGLSDAVTKMVWTDSKDVLKLVFLVGDAPPHMDYGDDVKYAETAQQAVRKNIYINTIQCGRESETTRVWRDIAYRSEGKYAAIAQDGAVVALATPYDGDLARLAAELDGTALRYGKKAERAARAKDDFSASKMAEAAPAPTAADRAVAKAKSAPAAEASSDLVSLSTTSGGAAAGIASVPAEALPDALVGKSSSEQKAIVESLQKKRAAIQNQIAELEKKRDAHLADQRKASGETKDSFDAQVVDMIQAEGKRVGLTF
jgi:Mg-chelatase subunit ChlD